jgi:hypothetical protein
VPRGHFKKDPGSSSPARSSLYHLYLLPSSGPSVAPISLPSTSTKSEVCRYNTTAGATIRPCTCHSGLSIWSTTPFESSKGALDSSLCTKHDTIPTLLAAETAETGVLGPIVKSCNQCLLCTFTLSNRVPLEHRLICLHWRQRSLMFGGG